MNAYVFSNVLFFFFINFHLLHPAQPCQWQPYKTVNEGSYFLSFLLIRLEFRVERSTEICVENNTIYNFRTSRYLVRPVTSHWICQMTNSFGVCSGNCVSKPVVFTISCLPTINGFLPLTSSFNYNNKNCDKAYWTSWSPVTNCSNSRLRVFTRIAKDCDQMPFPNNYCVNGYLKKKEEPCQPLWSEWVTIFCNSTNNIMKKQVRTRKCLYGNGSKTNNTGLCSNESAIINEQNCLDVTKKSSAEQLNENNNIIYIGVAIFSLVFFIIGMLMLIFRNRAHKKSKTNHIQVNDDLYAVVTKKQKRNEQNQVTTQYQTGSNDTTISNGKFNVEDDGTYEIFSAT